MTIEGIIRMAKEAANKNTIKTFVDYYIVSANKLAKEVGCIPLPKYIYTEAMKRFNKKVTGSIMQDSNSINANELMLRLKKENCNTVNMSTSSVNLSLPTSSPLNPGLSSSSNYIGTQPTLTTTPAVIHGVIQ